MFVIAVIAFVVRVLDINYSFEWLADNKWLATEKPLI